MDVLEQLIDEHRAVEALLARLEAVEEFADRNLALVEMADALSTHMEVEERRLYPLIEARLGKGEANETQAQHDNVRHALSKLFELVEDDERFENALAGFKVDLRNHVDKEETSRFPALRKIAGDEIAELGDAHRVEEDVKSELAAEGLDGID